MCISRVRDFKHREDDVGFGVFVGIATTAIVWYSLEYTMDQLIIVETLATKDGEMPILGDDKSRSSITKIKNINSNNDI